MTQSQKIWILRLLSIPALVYLPFVFVGIAFAIFHENRGDSLPFFALLAFIMGVTLSIALSRRTLFTPMHSTLKRPVYILLAIIAFEAGTYLYMVIQPR